MNPHHPAPPRLPRPRRLLRATFRTLALLLAFGVALLLLLAYWPMRRPPLVQARLSLGGYADTVARIEEKIRSAPPEIEPECRGQMLQHGRRTERVFVLMHGLSNCPAQFRAFGELLFRRGHNVLILRLPFHGARDRLTDWGRLSAQEMLDAANHAVDAARVLGRRVTVVGLSVNGTVAAWLAQHRADVDEVALLAPFLAPSGLPEWAVAPVGRLVRRLPNQWRWWDPEKRERGGNGRSYPRFPTHAVAEVLRVSGEVLEGARTTAPRCGRILVATTASDTSADLPLTRALVQRWRRHRPDAVRAYEFPREARVDHDFIDPASPVEQVELVYPKLLSLLLLKLDDG